MPDAALSAPDLAGTADERIRELAELAATRTLGAEWLKRQLDAVLLAWQNDETKLDIDMESHVDY